MKDRVMRLVGNSEHGSGTISLHRRMFKLPRPVNTRQREFESGKEYGLEYYIVWWVTLAQKKPMCLSYLIGFA